MKKLIIAHRGESFDAPENTLASIDLAWERGANAVEIDVHLSLDNHVVVIHDPNTKRVSRVNKKIKNLSFLQLSKIDVGSWKHKKYKAERISSLKEVLKTVPKNKKLIIEIKSKDKIIPFLIADIDDSGLEIGQIEFISFNFKTCRKLKAVSSSHKVLFLADLDYNWLSKLISPKVEKLIKKVKAANLDGLDVWAGKILTKSFVEKVKAANLMLYVWTVNDPVVAKKLFDWGVDGITTDRAEWMRELIDIKY